MKKNMEHKSSEELLAEADALLDQIHLDLIKGMDDEHQLIIEKHAEDLKHLKFNADAKTGKPESHDATSSAEGVHEAIQGIINAMHDLKNKYF